MAGKSAVQIVGLPEVEKKLDTLAQGARTAQQKPVYVGTKLFYGKFQERGTRRGVRPVRFLERAAQTIRSTANRILAGKLESGDVLSALVELARKARGLAAGKAPSARGKLRRSIKVQVGGTLRRSGR